MLLCCFHVERLLPCRHSDRKYQLFWAWDVSRRFQCRHHLCECSYNKLGVKRRAQRRKRCKGLGAFCVRVFFFFFFEGHLWSFLSSSVLLSPFPRMVPCWALWGALTGQVEPFCTHQRIKPPSSTQPGWIQIWMMLTWVSKEGMGCSRKGSGCDVIHGHACFGSFVGLWDSCRDFFKNLNLILVMCIIVIPAHQAWGCSAVLLRNRLALWKGGQVCTGKCFAYYKHSS